MLIRSSGFAAAVVLGFAALVMAQAAPPREEPRPAAAPRVAAPAQATNLDEGLATCLVLGSRNEVEICKFARERLKTEDAKAFADTMIKDHTAALERLEKFAGNHAAPKAGVRIGNPPADPAKPGLRLEVNGVVVAGGREGVAVGRAANDVEAAWNQIKHELAAECLTSAKRELEQAPAQDIDKCFIGLQIAMHMHMVTELKVFANHASPNLRGELQADLQSAQKHLQHAKTIMESQKGKTTTGAAAKPEVKESR